MDDEDILLVHFTAMRYAILSWKTDGTRWDQFAPAMRAYRALRLELGQDALNDAWSAAKGGHPLLWPFLRYKEAYRKRYRNSPAYKRHQAKYQSKPDVKARRAELARARRRSRKELAEC